MPLLCAKSLSLCSPFRMKTFLSFLLICAVISTAKAQRFAADSLLSKSHQYDSTLQKKEKKIDAVETSLNGRLDSVSSLQHRYDSTIQKPEQKIDSIQSAFRAKTDSVQNASRERIAILSSRASKYQYTIDSLTSLNLPTNGISHKLDSVTQLRQQTVAKAEQKMQALKTKATDKLKSLDLPPEAQEKISNATKNINGFNLPTKELNIPSLNTSGMPGLPDTSLGKLGDAGIQSPVGKLPGTGDVPGVGGELKNVQGEMKEVSGVTGDVNKYGKDLQNVTKGNLSEVKEAPKALENKAADLTGVKDLTGQTKELDQYKNQLGQLQDPAKNKDQLLQKGKQEAMNHFAGKEQVLQEAMEKVSKYKQKYSSLQSIHDLPKRRPNEMRGKPFRERLVPGIAFQIQRKSNDLLVDINVYAGYRFTGKFAAGLGWNQRVAYNSKSNDFNPHARVFGPRTFAEYNLFKGICPRVEFEFMNTFVPKALFVPATTDVGNREWVWTAFAGLKKDYRFLKKIKGTTMVMFNVYNPLHRSPYADVMNVRFGFEFPQKKKEKKASN